MNYASLIPELWKSLFSLIVAVITLALGWFVTQRFTVSWNLRQKHRENDLASVQQFHAIYGEFKEISKVWRLAKRPSEGPLTVPVGLRWELLTRACAVESKYETILVKIASERALEGRPRGRLGLFRQVLQQLRESIRDNVEIPFASRGPEYVFFNALAAEVTLIVSNSPLATTLTEREASDNLFAIAAVQKNDLAKALERFRGIHPEFAKIDRNSVDSRDGPATIADSAARGMEQ